MEKYNSIPEMEQEQAEQKWKYNKACVEAMTDEELVHLKSLIDEEYSQRFNKSEMKYLCFDCEDRCIIGVKKTPTCCPCGVKGWKQIVKWEHLNESRIRD